MSSNQRIYMDYTCGDRETAHWGYVWLCGCRPKSVCACLHCGPRLNAVPVCDASTAEAAYAACGAIQVNLYLSERS